MPQLNSWSGCLFPFTRTNAQLVSFQGWKFWSKYELLKVLQANCYLIVQNVLFQFRSTLRIEALMFRECSVLCSSVSLFIFCHIWKFFCLLQPDARFIEPLSSFVCKRYLWYDILYIFNILTSHFLHIAFTIWIYHFSF